MFEELLPATGTWVLAFNALMLLAALAGLGLSNPDFNFAARPCAVRRRAAMSGKAGPRSKFWG